MPSKDGKITPDLFDRMKAELSRQRAQPHVFWADQFHNEDGIAGYRLIGEEILDQLGPGIDTFCGAVDTAGMLVGVCRAIKPAQCRYRMGALEPAESPTLTTGRGGPDRVEGIGLGSGHRT